MDNSFNGRSRDVVVTNELGLHARSASKIAQLVQNAKATVWIIKDGKQANASSIIDVLTLACPKGSKLTLVIEDESDVETLNNLVHLFEIGFGE